MVRIWNEPMQMILNDIIGGVNMKVADTDEVRVAIAAINKKFMEDYKPFAAAIKRSFKALVDGLGCLDVCHLRICSAKIAKSRGCT